jgi:hypothetical protein
MVAASICAIAEGGSKGWIFRYAKNGRTRDMGLGSTNALSLAQAREKTAECRNSLNAFHTS